MPDLLNEAVTRYETADAAGHQRLASEIGLEILEFAAESGSPNLWSSLAAGGLLRRIEAGASGPASLLDLLEQESYAPPETGIPAMALVRAEGTGHAWAHDPAVARTAERLLHAAGDPAAAYRVERSRRDANRDRDRRRASATPDRFLTGRIVVIAGGHAPLRARVASMLRSAGAADVREIPSAKEGNRVQRDIDATVAGADLVVVVVRQMAHSTSDQVRLAAEKAGVPLVVAESAGTTGILRAVERHVSAQ